MGLDSWRHATNHNRMIQGPSSGTAPVELAYFAGSAIRLTTPSGLTVMIDPWRNHPAGTADWFYHDFPLTQVDIGVSTHAHFDHDALHRLDASTLLDRPIGTYQVADLKLTGIPDKHSIDTSRASYDMHRLASYFGGPAMIPPNNGRSWDNCLVLIETGGLRVLHWGDNRHDPPQSVWDQLTGIDVLILPIDGSHHVMATDLADTIIARIAPRLVVPCHYYVWNVTQRQSTLLPATDWLTQQPRTIDAQNGTLSLASLPDTTTAVDFADSVAFDVAAWHRANGTQVCP